eukprot:jgi/Botrbrau1/641/Bobra.0161s0030.1
MIGVELRPALVFCFSFAQISFTFAFLASSTALPFRVGGDVCLASPLFSGSNIGYVHCESYASPARRCRSPRSFTLVTTSRLVFSGIIVCVLLIV